jgi:hypothetical protein
MSDRDTLSPRHFVTSLRRPSVSNLTVRGSGGAKFFGSAGGNSRDWVTGITSLPAVDTASSTKADEPNCSPHPATAICPCEPVPSVDRSWTRFAPRLATRTKARAYPAPAARGVVPGS